MLNSVAKKIRYANKVVSRSSLEKVLQTDATYQKSIEAAVRAKASQREAEVERDLITQDSTRALPEERDASRAERALAHARKRVKELAVERDQKRTIAHNARVNHNREIRRKVASNNISIRRFQGEFREAFDLANDRKTTVFNKLYARNYRAVLEKAGMLGSEEEAEEEEFDDVSLGLQPQEEGEDGGGV